MPLSPVIFIFVILFFLMFATCLKKSMHQLQAKQTEKEKKEKKEKKNFIPTPGIEPGPRR